MVQIGFGYTLSEKKKDMQKENKIVKNSYNSITKFNFLKQINLKDMYDIFLAIIFWRETWDFGKTLIKIKSL